MSHCKLCTTYVPDFGIYKDQAPQVPHSCAYVNVVVIYLVNLPLHLDYLCGYIFGASV